MKLDVSNNNSKWKDAIEKEVATLIAMKYFRLPTPDECGKLKTENGWQHAPLRMIFDVIHDLRHKARLVVMGNQVDPHGLATRATVVKGISVRLLDLIEHRDGLETLCGDIGNAFINAETNEKVFTKLGPEIGADLADEFVIIRKALYGLTRYANRFHNLLADHLRCLGFKATRYDRDVWICPREDKLGYNYICTHVDDFKIVARDPSHWMKKIQDVFIVKSIGPPKYYLGNDYSRDSTTGQWQVGCTTYIKEALRRVESIFGDIKRRQTPLPTSRDYHPELDASPILNGKGHTHFQMLMGMLQWLVTIGRPDLCHANASLSRFGACLRETHLSLALHVFGYIKANQTY